VDFRCFAAFRVSVLWPFGDVVPPFRVTVCGCYELGVLMVCSVVLVLCGFVLEECGIVGDGVLAVCYCEGCVVGVGDS
jgi:hypothetical protein